MQKHLLYSAVALAALAMGSCSKEDTMNGGMPETTGASQVIEIAVENAGDGLTTRAGRPLLSSEAKQTIDNVAIIICNKNSNINNVATVKLFENWQTESEAYDDASGHGRKIRFTLDEGNELQEGKYIVYALGYYGSGGTDSQYTYNDQPLNSYLKTISAGGTFNKDIVIKNGIDENNAEELFAGAAEFQVDDETGNFSQGVTLHRQVAGMYTYAYNVPYFNKAKYLKVYASQESQDMVLGNFYTDVLGGNGENNALKNVINGTNLNANKTLIYQIDLNQWFTDIVDVNNDGIIDTYVYEYDSNGGLNENKESPNWHRPSGGVFDNVTLVKGSVFGGEFIIPFAAKAGNNTFTLELTDDSNSALRTWSVKLPSEQVPDSWSSWSGASWSDATTVTESESAFSVLRNHLYSIGSKAAEGDGGDKEEPDGPDNPQDLSTKQDIMLQVNDNWELIHQMEVD